MGKTMLDDLIQGAVGEAAKIIEINAEKQKIIDAEKVQKKRIQQKQIRALRNNYRPAGGFLSQGTGRGVTLGESSGLPNKLGTA